MTTITITYTLSEVGRRASLLAGGDGRRDQAVQVPVTPELLAQASVDLDGHATIDMRQNGYAAIATRATVEYESVVLRVDAQDAPIADPAAWVLDLARRQAEIVGAAKAEVEAMVAARRRDEEEAIAKKTQATRAEIAKWLASDPRASQQSGATTPWWVGDSKVQIEYAEDPDAIRAEARRRNDLQAAAVAAAEAARIADRDTWIRAHGSDRLKKCLDLGLIDKCAGVYRDERLAHDFPGWIVDCDETAEESEIRNPSIEALAVLEEARKISADAMLVKVREEASDCDEYETPEWREAVRLDELPGIESSKVFYRLI